MLPGAVEERESRREREREERERGRGGRRILGNKVVVTSKE